MWWDIPSGAWTDGGQEALLFSTNSYRPESINAKGRLKRGRSEKIIMAGSATRKPHDFNLFLENTATRSRSACSWCEYGVANRQFGSRKDHTGNAHQLGSSKGYNLLLLLLWLYINITLWLFYQADFTLSIIYLKWHSPVPLCVSGRSVLRQAYAIQRTVFVDTGFKNIVTYSTSLSS